MPSVCPRRERAQPLLIGTRVCVRRATIRTEICNGGRVGVQTVGGRRSAAAAAAAFLCALATAEAAATPSGPIRVQLENARPGTPGWDGPGTGAIEGYAE